MFIASDAVMTRTSAARNAQLEGAYHNENSNNDNDQSFNTSANYIIKLGESSTDVRCMGLSRNRANRQHACHQYFQWRSSVVRGLLHWLSITFGVNIVYYYFIAWYFIV